MMVPLLIALGAAIVVMVATVLVHRDGVRQGMLMSRMSLQLSKGEDPLHDPDDVKPNASDEQRETN